MARVSAAALLLVTGIMVMLVLHLLVIVWAIRRGTTMRRRRAASSRDEEEHAEAEGLTAEELGQLSCQEFKPAAAGVPGGECAVCLEAFLGGDQCRVLPGCRHGFHTQCVDSWLRKSRRCPVCRAEVTGRGNEAGAVVDEAVTSVSVVERA